MKTLFKPLTALLCSTLLLTACDKPAAPLNSEPAAAVSVAVLDEAAEHKALRNRGDDGAGGERDGPPFGAEAAARHHFGVSAKSLSRQQASYLAAVLPNPRVWSASHPTAYVSRRAGWIRRRCRGCARLRPPAGRNAPGPTVHRHAGRHRRRNPA